ncbi:S49 family peptidase [Tessaracoccus sp. ZS01]|uniref:S49 family peptidase n=1 Tax=Tessaracoccus sp. ZS01 TaxID=1906324 RepID=UPI00096E44B9|nr:S49 family peptidase [Tessaracoccus sp. ZS01]MCG6567970.1 S49 family peptidase [Tessaracoccus sp. ZS01]OMG54427.1 hypothetical protein BJN44_10150 [Tessaracoccus sp. ZS01]
MNDDRHNFPPPSPRERGTDIQSPHLMPRQGPQGPPPLPVGPSPAKGAFARGFGGGVGLGLGLGGMLLVTSLVTALMMVVSLAALAPSAAGSASTGLTTMWGSGSDTLRAVNVSGAILSDASDGALLSAGTFGNEVAAQIDELTAEDASGLVLLVNTPGGSIGGSRAISDAVDRYQERTGHKVLVHVTSMSASGGVYATASADEIISDHGALIGSIGVIFGPLRQYTDVVATTGTILESGVTTTGGITEEYLSAGKGKDFGNPFRPITEEERAHYLAGLDVEYDNFVSHVATHRDIPAEKITGQLGAYLFDPETAKEHGLIDDIMGRDAFFRHAAEAAGLDPDNTRVEATRQPTAWEALLGAQRAFGEAPAVEQGPGMVPAVSRALCGGGQPLAFSGELAAVCG